MEVPLSNLVIDLCLFGKYLFEAAAPVLGTLLWLSVEVENDLLRYSRSALILYCIVPVSE